MKKTHHITAFYLETILLIIVFMGIVMVLTNIFGGSKAISSSAKHLNTAVCLAQNAAEAVSESDSAGKLADLLGADSAGEIHDESSVNMLRVNYNEYMRPDKDGRYHLDVSWEPVSSGSGTLVSSNISVYFGESDRPVYTLKTAVFLEEGSR